MWHGALLDAEILVEVYGELTGGRQRSLAFAEARAASPSGLDAVARRGRAQRISPSRVSDEEIRAHGEHVASLGDGAIWRRYGVPGA